MLVAPLLMALAQAAVSPTGPSPSPTPPSGPVVELTTSLGVIKIALDPVKAPISVDNFLTYVRAGFYDGTVFHRVMPGFMIQGGGLGPDLKEKTTGPPIRNEAKNLVRNSRGTVAMARLTNPNSATSQFYINVKDNHSLDFGIAGAGYAVFGAVVGGMDVVDRIVGVPTTSKGAFENVPVTAVLIKTARVAGETKVAPAAKPAAPKPDAPKP